MASFYPVNVNCILPTQIKKNRIKQEAMLCIALKIACVNGEVDYHASHSLSVAVFFFLFCTTVQAQGPGRRVGSTY